MKNTIKCLCGACEFAVELADDQMAACHCSMCQRWSAGMFMTVELKSPTNFEAVNSLKEFKSSEWGRRMFCENCGTPLIWQMADKSFTAASAGALVDKAHLRFTDEIFVDEKMPGYPLTENTIKKTAAEVMAEFGV